LRIGGRVFTQKLLRLINDKGMYAFHLLTTKFVTSNHRFRLGWYRSKVLARYISIEKNTVSFYGGVIAKPSRAKGERPWWNKKYISHFAFVLQLER
jgi:hypothetical protein